MTNPVDSSTAQALLAALEAAANKAPGDRQLVTLINVVSRYIGETEKRLAVLEAKS